MRARTLVLAVLTALAAVAALAQDVVIFRNGDRLTGTIQRVEQGKVRYRVDIDWLTGRVRADEAGDES